VVLPVPKSLVGAWRAVRFTGSGIVKDRQSYTVFPGAGGERAPFLSFEAPPPASAKDTRPITNGFFSDGCNDGQTASAFGPNHSISIGEVSSTLVLCFAGGASLSGVIERVRSWQVRESDGKTTLLTFYDGDHHEIAVFERVIFGMKK
jgi:hypothetical protein